MSINMEDCTPYISESDIDGINKIECIKIYSEPHTYQGGYGYIFSTTDCSN
jgi:hypothetical protein